MARISVDDYLCESSHCQLLVVDIQEKLTGAMAETMRERVIHRAGVLLQSAGLLGVPVLVSEQYPKGLGPTEEGVARHFLQQTGLVEKTCFSCSGNEQFLRRLKENSRHQVVLVGMETHICVLQTAIALKAAGYTVFVVEDGVCSREESNHHNGLSRLRDAGVIVTNTESVVFEWLRDARHEHFKAISSLVK